MLDLWQMECLHRSLSQLCTLAVHASYEEALEEIDALLWQSHCSQLQQVVNIYVQVYPCTSLHPKLLSGSMPERANVNMQRIRRSMLVQESMMFVSAVVCLSLAVTSAIASERSHI